MTHLPLISLLTFVPLVGAVLLLGIEPGLRHRARTIAISVSAVACAVCLCLWWSFDPQTSKLQFVERYAWIPTLRVEYFVGVDGLSLLMVLLSAVVTLMALVAAKPPVDKPHLYFSLMLILQAGLFGTFTALNFFHWFLFWEISLIPAFFLIRFWGGPARQAAATQFLIYSLLGSVALLLGFLAIYRATKTFDFIQLAELARAGQLKAALARQLGWYDLTPGLLSGVVFVGIFFGLAVKVPLMPFHTWLPAAYTEAPTPVTMLLTGVMSKMGVYGFVRLLLPMFPEPMRLLSTPLLWLAILTIVFSAYAAMAQKDLKRILAYSSINHLGYCLLGVFALAKGSTSQTQWLSDGAAVFHGVILQMFNHGVTAATLFCLIGFLEQRSQGRRGLDDFGGLRQVAPVYCGLTGIALFSSLGLPGLNGFIGEFLIFKGVFGFAPWASALAALGLLVTAIFFLTILQRVFSGPLNEDRSAFADLTSPERWLVLPATVLMFAIGIWPQFLIGHVNSTVRQWVEQVRF